MSTRVIAFANQKGGVGKTTTAINMAAATARLGRSILLIDMDPQANATSGLGVEPNGTSIYGSLMGEEQLTDRIVRSPIKNLDVIPSELELAGAEIEVARRDNYLHAFSEALAPIVESELYDLIFIDCPPSLGILTMNALTAADSVLIPLQSEYYALEGLSTITTIIQQIRSNGTNARLTIDGIIMTMFDGRTNLSRQVMAEVATHFSDLLFKTPVPRSVRISEAPSHGMPVIEYDPTSSGALAYKVLAADLLKRLDEGASAASSSETQKATEPEEKSSTNKKDGDTTSPPEEGDAPASK